MASANKHASRCTVIILLYYLLFINIVESQRLFASDNTTETKPEQKQNASKQNDNLIERSPFLPKGYQIQEEKKSEKQNKVERTVSIELRGAVMLDGQWKVNLFDRQKRRGNWIGVNDPKANIKVTHYDPANKTVSFINQQGEKIKLSLISASNRSIPVARNVSSTQRSLTPNSRTGETQKGATETSKRITNRRRVIRNRKAPGTPRTPVEKSSPQQLPDEIQGLIERRPDSQTSQNP